MLESLLPLLPLLLRPRWCWCPCPRLASMERLSTPSPALASFLLSFAVLRASSPPSQPTTSFCHFSLFLFSHFSICGANERTNKRMSEQTRSTFNTLKCRNFGCFFAHKTILMLVVCRLAHTTRSSSTTSGWPWCACGAVGGLVDGWLLGFIFPGASHPIEVK